MPDLAAIADLCQRCIGVVHPGYFGTRLATDPTILPDGILVEEDGGRPVSTVTAHRFALRFGAAVIPCGGIANVSTDPAFRGRGLARHLLGRARERFAAEGLPISLLSAGAPAFYRPLGFEIWERRETHLLSLRMPPALLLLPPPGVTLRPVAIGDAGAIATLRESRDGRRVGALVRSPDLDRAHRHWTIHYPFEDPDLAWVAVGSDGMPVAAIRAAVDPEGTGWAQMLEFASADDAGAAAAALVARFAAEASAKGVKAVRLPAADHDLEAALRPFTATSVEVPNTSLMLRVADLTGFLEALRPELDRRALAAGQASGQVTLVLGNQSAGLAIRDHRVAVIPATGDAPRAELDAAGWVKVIMGVELFSAQPFARRSRLDEAGLNLLDALFPRRDAVFHDADSF